MEESTHSMTFVQTLDLKATIQDTRNNMPPVRNTNRTMLPVFQNDRPPVPMNGWTVPSKGQHNFPTNKFQGNGEFNQGNFNIRNRPRHQQYSTRVPAKHFKLTENPYNIPQYETNGSWQWYELEINKLHHYYQTYHWHLKTRENELKQELNSKEEHILNLEDKLSKFKQILRKGKHNPILHFEQRLDELETVYRERNQLRKILKERNAIVLDLNKRLSEIKGHEEYMVQLQKANNAHIHKNTVLQKQVEELQRVSYREQYHNRESTIGLLKQDLETFHSEAKRNLKLKDDEIEDLNFRLSKQLVENEQNARQYENEAMTLQNEIKVLQTQIEDLKRKLREQNNDATELVTHELDKVRSEVKRKHEEVLHLTARLSKQSIESEQNAEMRRQYENEVIKLQNEIKVLQNEIEDQQSEPRERNNNAIELVKRDLEKVQSEVKRKDKEIKDLTARLSEEMNKKVSANEESLENVSVKNRPMNISGEYQQLCSNQWHEAKTELDKSQGNLREEEALKLLCDILMEAEITSNNLHKTSMIRLKQIVTNPVSLGDTTLKDTSAVQLPDYVTNTVGDMMRNNTETLDVAALAQVVKTKISSKYPNTGDILNNHKIKLYIEDSLRLTWKMTLQRPPMRFYQDGINAKWQGEKKQEPSWKSHDPADPDSVVKYYVYPALYHGDTMMVKGKVFIGKR